MIPQILMARVMRWSGSYLHTRPEVAEGAVQVPHLQAHNHRWVQDFKVQAPSIGPPRITSVRQARQWAQPSSGAAAAVPCQSSAVAAHQPPGTVQRQRAARTR